MAKKSVRKKSKNVKKKERPISKKEARKLLAIVKPEKSFWVNNGPIISSLRHLPKAIDDADYNTFRHHVNDKKNDFARWIEEVIGDKKLAASIKRTKNKKDVVIKLKARVNHLKSIAIDKKT